jgi:hypothetical protein
VIPALGTMIGSYIIFRMMEVVLFSGSRYSGKAQHVLASVLAGIVGIVTLFNMLEIWLSGSPGPK